MDKIISNEKTVYDDPEKTEEILRGMSTLNEIKRANTGTSLSLNDLLKWFHEVVND